jgi:hypothetical protein
MDDEKIINMDLCALGEVQQIFYSGLKKRLLLVVWATTTFEIVVCR